MLLDHVNLRTNDLPGTIAFYRDVLGLEPGPRPDFAFEGAWLYGGGVPILHLRAPNPDRQGTTGGVDHIAFLTTEFDELVGRLKARAIPHRLGRLPDGSRLQCFFADPNGVTVEVTAEAPASG